MLHLPGDMRIGVTTNSAWAINQAGRMVLGAYLPGARVENGLQGNATYMVEHTEQRYRRGLTQDYHTVQVHDRWQNQFPADLPHLLYGIARAYWLQRGLFPVHAACVEQGGKGTLLAGHSGMGKSSLALALVTQHGRRLVSGNTTLVRIDQGALVAVAGTPVMTLKTADFQKSGYKAADKTQYGDRTAFTLQAEQYSSTSQCAIGCIVLPRISGSRQTWHPVQALSAVHRLHPQFMDVERQDVVVAEGAGVYTGIVSVNVRRQLGSALAGALRSTPVFEGMGSQNFLADRIAHAA